MESIEQSLTLNGVTRTGNELLHLCTEEAQNSSLPDWERSLHRFILEWLNGNDYVTLFTSGSTGAPKEIHQLKRHMVASAGLTRDYFGLNANTQALLCLPISYIAGKMMVVRAFLTGMNLITTEPSANPFEYIHTPITFAAITPYQLAHSMETLRRGGVVTIIVGGGEIPAELDEQCSTLPTSVYATYGMTETSSHVALRAVNGPRQSPLYEVLTGVEVSTDSRGCLTITAPALTNQTLVTNDVVRIADSRHFEWIGRADNVINSGGVKIFPEQVEKKLFPHIHRRYFVAGQPDDALGERVVLFIEGEPLQAEEQQQLKHLFPTILQRYETPRQLVAIPHFLLSDAGKVQKRATLEQYHKSNEEK